MNQKNILKKIENNELTAYDAFKELYPEKKEKIGKRAIFMKISIQVPEEGKRVNRLLKVLFAIPIPMMFARMGLRLAQRFIKTDDINLKEISKLLKYSKNSVISVESSDALVDIKIM